MRKGTSIRVDSYEANRQDGITADCSQLELRGDRVQIESFEDEARGSTLRLKQTILIPDVAKEPSRLGRVVALGNGRMPDGKTHYFDVRVGDVVLCPRYPKSGTGIEWRGRKLFWMRDSEILAKVGFDGARS